MSARAEQALDALGNPVRRQILGMLAQRPRPVREIADALPISRPAVSRHLKVLRQAGLVTSTAHGTQNIFSLDRVGFDDVRHWLEGFWDEALARFALLAENTAPNTQDQESP